MGTKTFAGDSQFHAVETWLRDSDDGHRVTVEGDGPTDNVVVAVEVAPPEAVAEHRDRLAVGNGVIILGDGAAQCRLDAQYREICAGDQLRRDLRHVIAVAEIVT